MLPVILVGLGIVSLSATAYSFFLTGEIESEKEVQKKTLAEHDKWVRQSQKEKRARIAELVNIYRDDIENKLSIRKSICEEFLRVLKGLNEQLTGSQLTSRRRNAILNLKSDVAKKTNEIIGHIDFMEAYLMNLDACLERGAMPVPLPNSLPPEYAYHGRLISVPKESLLGARFYQNRFGQRLIIEDPKILNQNEFNDLSTVPVLVKRNGNNLRINVGAGLLKWKLDNGDTIHARVQKVRPASFSDVTAFGVKMRLNREDQKGRKKELLRGGCTTIYGLQYEYDLKPFNIHGTGKDYTRVLVTERRSDSFSERHFKHIPIRIDNKRFESVIHKIARLEYSRERWLVAPSKKDISDSRVRMQNGSVGFVAEFLPSGPGCLYLNFVEFLEDVEALDTSGIYAAFKSTIVPYMEDETLVNAVTEECTEFAHCVEREFKHQAHIMAQHKGSLDFVHWESILNALRREHLWEEEITVELIDVVFLPDGKIELLHDEGLQLFLQKHSSRTIGAFLDGRNVGFISTERDDNEYSRTLLTPFGENLKQEDFLDRFSLKLKTHPASEDRQLEALRRFRMGSIENADIKACLLNDRFLKKMKDYDLKEVFPFDKALNASQQNVLQKALSTPDLLILQGPPGTGKTRFIIELIRQTLALDAHAKILVTSQSNVAVNNVMEKLPAFLALEKMIRCGNRKHVNPRLVTCDLVERYAAYKKSLKDVSATGDMEMVLNWWKRNLSDTIPSDIGEILVEQVSVTGATCVYLGNEKNGLSRAKFDLVIVDEAGRATLPELLIPLRRGKKVVLIGDHCQLPPFIAPSIMENRYDFGLTRTEIDSLVTRSLFSKLFELAPESRRAVLDTTYRLPQQVADMVSTLFYNQKLVAAKPKVPPRYFADVVTCLDMNGDKEYFDDKMGGSRFNEKESEIVKWILGRLGRLIASDDRYGNAIPSIGVITPYALQKERLWKTTETIRRTLSQRGITVYINTVDAFQGGESDMVIYCATRKGKATEFLNDRFRLNVALSRVKQELLIIGDMETLALPVHHKKQNYFRSILHLIEQGKGTRIRYGSAPTRNLESLFQKTRINPHQ
ncbi:MAG: hypothetical protein B6240_01945 [Desulfobacteraceae bacterium 4572_87]|nr:MAG: hypothetical protein B6240_01945 [Desulfobacteraceae bacterium 4572_87]